MNFRECPICKLTLPQNLLIPILVNYHGKVVKVFICENCKKREENKHNKGIK